MPMLSPNKPNRPSLTVSIERAARGLCTMAAVWMSLQAASGGAQAQDGLACGAPYVIGAGDTLGSIAARAYGDPKRFDVLLEANPGVIGPNPDAVVAGMEITIPCLDAAGNALAAGADAEMTAAIASAGPLQPDELETLFAPVALFPDQVLTPVLVATTFPLEAVSLVVV